MPKLATAATFLVTAFGLGQTAPPATPKKPVTDTYGTVKVTDDYRWLEDFDDPAVKQWADSQNSAARSALDRLPGRDAIAAQLRLVFQPPQARYIPFAQRGGFFYAMKHDRSHQHPEVVALTSLVNLASERVVLDPDVLDPKHLTSMDFVRISPDGRYLAVSLSVGGSESGDVHVFETATGKALPDVIPRVNYGTAGGDVAWNIDATGFYYTRYPRDGERPPADMHFYQQVYFHKLGDNPANDTYEIGKDFPRIAEISFRTSRDHRYLAAVMAIGDGGDFDVWLHIPGHEWRRLAAASDSVKDLAFGDHDDIFLLSKSGAPRGKILHLDVSETIDHAIVRIPESKSVIETFSPCAVGLFVNDLDGGPADVRFFPASGAAAVHVPLPKVSTGNCSCLQGGANICYVGTYLDPGAIFQFDPRSHKLEPTALHVPPPIPLDNYEVVREFVVSTGGAKVPLNIMRPKGIVLDGSHPTVLTGYGGYSISITPNYPGPLAVLLQHGVVLAEANLRGGGEYGEEWHNAGKLTHKQNVFDDFAACAQYLIDKKYTDSAKLGIIGGSNGGLLMGAALTQHPDRYHAVVSMVGIYDMLRVELSPNGAFNTTEFGTVKEADQFKALYAYSPYHHVKDGTQYPAILLTTGDNDPRVDPMNSRKMTARLQASRTKQPVLLRTSGHAGHGIGSSVDEQVSLWTDIDAFLLDELGAAK